MKANFTNLRKALKASADAHKVKFEHWRDDGMMALESVTIPVMNDVQMICDAFFGNHEMVEECFGYTCVSFGYDFLPEVDEMTLQFALPYGTVL